MKNSSRNRRPQLIENTSGDSKIDANAAQPRFWPVLARLVDRAGYPVETRDEYDTDMFTLEKPLMIYPDFGYWYYWYIIPYTYQVAYIGISDIYVYIGHIYSFVIFLDIYITVNVYIGYIT